MSIQVSLEGLIYLALMVWGACQVGNVVTELLLGTKPRKWGNVVVVSIGEAVVLALLVLVLWQVARVGTS